MGSAALEARIAVIIRSASWLGIVAHAGFVPLFALTGQPVLAAFNVGSVAVWIAAWALNRRGASTVAMWMLTAEVVAHAVLAVLLLGWRSGFQYYLLPLIPFMMFNDRARTTTVTAASAVVLVTFGLLRALAPGDVRLPFALQAFEYANLAIPLLMLGLVSFTFRSASTKVEHVMTEMARTDPLTGLTNRRRMEERLHDEAERHRAHGTSFSVVLADVDHFKEINDRHGHDAGDRLLARVGRLLTQGLRADDVVARWGGEEFLLLLPGADQGVAEEVARRLRAAAEAQLADVEGVTGPMTLTFGVASFGPAATIESCLKAADEALYRGKAEGRNRVVVASV